MKTQLPKPRAVPVTRARSDKDTHHIVAVGSHTRSVFVDDVRETTDMVKQSSSATSDTVSVGELDSAAGLVAEVIVRRADVVVLDPTIPGPPQLAAIGLLTPRAPRCSTIGLSGYDDHNTSEAVRAAGACGQVSNRDGSTSIILAVRRDITRLGKPKGNGE